MPTDQAAVALAEFTAALSLAADQAAGLSLEHRLRCCLLATRLARRAGVAAGELREVYYAAAHLDQAVRTGTRCSYSPPDRRS